MSIRIRASKSISRLAIAGVIAACALSTASIASAQDRASAEELFMLGKGAMARQELTKACNYFQASLNADFALGTLLNLAICHEQAGKIASAWGEYRTLEDRARRATPPQADRAQFAHDHAEALRPRLSRVHIVVSKEAAALPGLVVKIDGVVAAPELFDAGVPIDLGKRKVTATAPDYEEWSTIVVVDDERLKLEASIPPLKAAAVKPTNGSVDLHELERISGEQSQRTVGFVIGGIGVASLITGGVFGLLAIGAGNDAKCESSPERGTCFTTNQDKDGNRTPNPNVAKAQDAYDRANTYGWVSNVTFITGLIGAGIGTYLILTAGSSSQPAKKVTAWARALPSPVPIAGGAALSFSGSL